MSYDSYSFMGGESIKESFSANAVEDETTELELAVNVLGIALKAAAEADGRGKYALVAVIFAHLHSRLLSDNNDIHAVARNFSSESRASIIRTYYLAHTALKRHDLLPPAPIESSALFAAAKSGRANLLAVFGGQGNVEEYFDELVVLFNTYEAHARNFITQGALTLAHHSSSSEAQANYSSKIDVLGWLANAGSRPSTEHLLATHLSLPLIGLTQLTNYYITFKILEKTPGELRDMLAGELG
ncbi:hypothetical protein HDU87_000139 [Geranomyces variabilis]|uniref:Fatty acid synthase subunit beta N-terminal domain-containing protein n=1 Tax=Geranomyces variabilis TaxID=109894 RepID=A0AAD5XV17_9FUNG|nr:hypothetical protein HDU87_000139 [Geranomyces variabilis]